LIVLGLVAGFVGSKVVNRSGGGLLLDMVLGVVGAIVGGLLLGTFGVPGAGPLDVYSFAVAAAGAMAFLVIYHILVRSSR
jgi:uncharacterized membrane protein YeaQ/YmgE (transglycosylase-associated protein family)